jgi:hypothetical protein
MFRFTIRDVLRLTVVLAMGAAWYGERDNRLRERDEWHKQTIGLAGDVARLNKELFLIRGVAPLNDGATAP